MLEEITVITIYHFLLVFSRLGAAFMTLPGFGEVYVTPRARLIMAVAASLLITPVLSPTFPPVPGDVLVLFTQVSAEVLIGLFIGGIGRMLQAILHIGGMIIAFQSGLASALLFDASQGSQGSVFGNFMTLVGLTLLFATDMHHLMLAGVTESYYLFEVGTFPVIGDFSSMAARVLSEGFLVGVKIAAPMIVIGLCVYVAAGLMGRLMPQMHVFLVIMPGQILVSFAILMITLSAGIMWYLQFFEETFRVFLGQ